MIPKIVPMAPPSLRGGGVRVVNPKKTPKGEVTPTHTEWHDGARKVYHAEAVPKMKKTAAQNLFISHAADKKLSQALQKQLMMESVPTEILSWKKKTWKQASDEATKVAKKHHFHMKFLHSESGTGIP
jgi:hypothetical protein